MNTPDEHTAQLRAAAIRRSIEMRREAEIAFWCGAVRLARGAFAGARHALARRRKLAHRPDGARLEHA